MVGGDGRCGACTLVAKVLLGISSVAAGGDHDCSMLSVTYACFKSE